jgi:hypothetical protein
MVRLPTRSEDSRLYLDTIDCVNCDAYVGHWRIPSIAGAIPVGPDREVAAFERRRLSELDNIFALCLNHQKFGKFP